MVDLNVRPQLKRNDSVHEADDVAHGWKKWSDQEEQNVVPLKTKVNSKEKQRSAKGCTVRIFGRGVKDFKIQAFFKFLLDNPWMILTKTLISDINEPWCNPIKRGRKVFEKPHPHDHAQPLTLLVPHWKAPWNLHYLNNQVWHLVEDFLKIGWLYDWGFTALTSISWPGWPNRAQTWMPSLPVPTSLSFLQIILPYPVIDMDVGNKFQGQDHTVKMADGDWDHVLVCLRIRITMWSTLGPRKVRIARTVSYLALFDQTWNKWPRSARGERGWCWQHGS